MLDLSKAFDRIGRQGIWEILFENGLPLNLIKMVHRGNGNNKLRSKHNGKTCKLVTSNIGVFRGITLSGNLFWLSQRSHE